MKNLILIITIFIQIGCASDTYYYKNDQKVNLTFKSSNDLNVDYYKNTNGILLGVTDKILVKFKEEINIGQYLAEYNLFAHKVINSKTYLLQTKDRKLTLDIANQLHNKEDVAYAHPDFNKKILRR